MWDNTEHPADQGGDFSEPMTRLDKIMLGGLLAVYIAGCVLLACNLF